MQNPNPRPQQSGLITMQLTPEQLSLRARLVVQQKFEPIPSARDFLLEPFRFNKFCELLRSRLIQIELAGYVRSIKAVYDFVDLATLTYADYQLRLAGQVNARKLLFKKELKT